MIYSENKLKSFHNLAKNFVENFRVIDTGERKRFLDQEKLKIAWLIENFDEEFKLILKEYMKTEDYKNITKVR